MIEVYANRDKYPEWLKAFLESSVDIQTNPMAVSILTATDLTLITTDLTLITARFDSMDARIRNAKLTKRNKTASQSMYLSILTRNKLYFNNLLH